MVKDENKGYFYNMAINASTNKLPVGSFESIPLLDIERFYEHVNTLTEQQKKFPSLLNDWFESPSNDIIVLSGSPGSGKTFTVIETLEYVNTQILKMAYTAKTACNIGGSTIHSTLHLEWDESSFLHKLISDIQKLDDEDPNYKTNCLNLSQNLQGHLSCLRNPRIIVIDEVGMISFWLMHEIVKYFFSQTAEDPKLFIMMGDEFQLRPVNCKYNIFNMKPFEFKMIQLSDNKRFTADYNVLINKLKDLMVQGDEDEFFAYVISQFPILENVYDYQLKECNRVLVYTNETAKKYNNFYIEMLPGPKFHFPKIINNKVYPNHSITLKKNCDIVVTKNCVVPNGTLLKFEDYDQVKDLLICKNPNRENFIKIGRDNYTANFPVTVGFATTIHKFQGETINEPNILMEFDQCKDLNLIYTALSRVRSMDQLIGVIL